ncbi:MAG TPA: argininosuccinate synthase [Candidatus Xenobia bacterium]|jgi:argininosuccinate synthase
MQNKIVLAYSGGLDTSVAIKWLKDTYHADIVCVCVDLGAAKNLEGIQKKALTLGAIASEVVDAKAAFAQDFLLPALFANALYEGRYPLATALSRPLIAQELAKVAQQHDAFAVAHGCTGKGNDQVRFELTLMALAPHVKVIAPAREWGFTREEEIAYAGKHGIPIPVTVNSPYSLDVNLWGRSAECGSLENIGLMPPPDVYDWTTSPEQAPDAPAIVKIAFDKGVPVALNGNNMALLDIISELNRLGGLHGIGRIDHVENRLVGIKSHEIYEAPAAVVLLEAHKDLEMLVHPKDVTHFKTAIDKKFAEMTYNGQWFHPLMGALQAFQARLQEPVTGTITVKLFKGHVSVVARESANSLYNFSLATYDKGDQFNHQAAVGFIQLFGLPQKTLALLHEKQLAAAQS